MKTPLFAIHLHPTQAIVVLVIGVLLFGKRLPEISRWVGTGVAELEKELAALKAGVLGDRSQRNPRPARRTQLADADSLVTSIEEWHPASPS